MCCVQAMLHGQPEDEDGTTQHVELHTPTGVRPLPRESQQVRQPNRTPPRKLERRPSEREIAAALPPILIASHGPHGQADAGPERLPDTRLRLRRSNPLPMSLARSTPQPNPDLLVAGDRFQNLPPIKTPTLPLKPRLRDNIELLHVQFSGEMRGFAHDREHPARLDLNESLIVSKMRVPDINNGRGPSDADNGLRLPRLDTRSRSTANFLQSESRRRRIRARSMPLLAAMDPINQSSDAYAAHDDSARGSSESTPGRFMTPVVCPACTPCFAQRHHFPLQSSDEMNTVAALHEYAKVGLGCT